MLLDTLGDVIAKRELFVRDNPSRRIVVMMGKPQLWEGGPDHLCPILIVGVGDEKIRSARGVDAFQSMELAFKLIAIQLKAIRRGCSVDLCRWEGDDDPCVGFPNPDL
jgi:hypothetical protein